MRPVANPSRFFATNTSTQTSPVENFPFPADGLLEPRMLSSFEINGFLILDGFLTDAQCDCLVSESARIIDEFQCEPGKTETFFGNQKIQEDHNRGDAYQDSVDKLVCFLEPIALKDSKLVVPKAQAVNKIGHALGENSAPFRAITLTNVVRRIAEQLGVPNPLLTQSMLICKFPQLGGEVSPHQDTTFLYTEPNTTLAFWMPLQDATIENACLQAIPGSHKTPVLFRYVRYEDQTQGYETLDGRKLSQEELDQAKGQWDLTKMVPLPMKRGSLILFKGSLVHGSGPNASDKPRNAYTFHVISADSKYDGKNWLQRKEFAPVKSDE